MRLEDEMLRTDLECLLVSCDPIDLFRLLVRVSSASKVKGASHDKDGYHLINHMRPYFTRHANYLGLGLHAFSLCFFFEVVVVDTEAWTN